MIFSIVAPKENFSINIRVSSKVSSWKLSYNGNFAKNLLSRNSSLQAYIPPRGGRVGLPPRVWGCAYFCHLFMDRHGTACSMSHLDLRREIIMRKTDNKIGDIQLRKWMPNLVSLERSWKSELRDSLWHMRKDFCKSGASAPTVCFVFQFAKFSPKVTVNVWPCLSQIRKTLKGASHEIEMTVFGIKRKILRR